MDEEIITIDRLDRSNYKEYLGKTLNVRKNVFLSNIDIDVLPIKFNVVGRDFNVYNNRLTTLEWSPRYVGGDFVCSSNCLKDLSHSPIYVRGDFICSYNSIKTLEYHPEYVGGIFSYFGNSFNETVINLFTMRMVKVKAFKKDTDYDEYFKVLL
ncbi:MAG: hypothetical protein MJZ34_10425 [Paludibacteraceae bacterium]|nr:hypothetical protein [Paludibacteraceae bacterium]